MNTSLSISLYESASSMFQWFSVESRCAAITATIQTLKGTVEGKRATRKFNSPLAGITSHHAYLSLDYLYCIWCSRTTPTSRIKDDAKQRLPSGETCRYRPTLRAPGASLKYGQIWVAFPFWLQYLSTNLGHASEETSNALRGI